MGRARRATTVVVEDVEAVRLREIDELERQMAQSPVDRPVVAAATEATLTITRNAGDDVQDRTVNLWFDGERWESLRYGHSLTRSITPGPHRLKAHNTLRATFFDFDVRPGEHVRLRCVNALASGGALLLIWLGWAAIRVRIERDLDARDVGDVGAEPPNRSAEPGAA